MPSYLFGETGGFPESIQDQVIRMTIYQRLIMKKNIIDKCSLCTDPGETIKCLSAGCSTLTGRHNIAMKIMHLEIAYEAVVGKFTVL